MSGLEAAIGENYDIHGWIEGGTVDDEAVDAVAGDMERNDRSATGGSRPSDGNH